MANRDTPLGFWPLRHRSGGNFCSTRYKVTASATIYGGDLLKLVAGGTVEVAAAADENIVGVAAHYIVAAASGDYWCDVYDDPNIVFGVQASNSSSTSVTLTMVGGMVELLATSGDTATQISKMEANVTSVGTSSAQLQILGKIDEENNDWSSTSTNLEVLINEHVLAGAKTPGI